MFRVIDKQLYYAYSNALYVFISVNVNLVGVSYPNTSPLPLRACVRTGYLRYGCRGMCPIVFCIMNCTRERERDDFLPMCNRIMSIPYKKVFLFLYFVRCAFSIFVLMKARERQRGMILKQKIMRARDGLSQVTQDEISPPKSLHLFRIQLPSPWCELF